MHKTIYEGESGILWRDGAIIKTLKSGRHGYSLWRNEKITTVNIQVQEYLCQTQEFTTKDNLMVRFAIRLSARTEDVALFRKTLPEFTHESFMQNAVSDAARVLVSELTLDELLNKTSELHSLIEKRTKDKLKAAGIQLVSISPISVLIPRSLRQAFEAELSVRKKSMADLEEARGRTAVLRHLANAASMVEKQPVLLQLLMGQKARHVQFQFESSKQPQERNVQKK